MTSNRSEEQANPMFCRIGALIVGNSRGNRNELWPEAWAGNKISIKQVILSQESPGPWKARINSFDVAYNPIFHEDGSVGGLFLLIQDERPQLQVVGEASNGVEAITEAVALQPEVIIMDVSLPEMNGIDATREIHRSPATH